MIVREAIQRIQSAYSKGLPDVDVELSPRHVYSKLLTVRNKIIYQQASKSQKISSWNIQTISCVEMVVMPSHECPCAPPTNCEILRSKYKLPRPITDINGHILKSVNSINGFITYSEISLNEKKYKKGSKYTSSKPDFFVLDGYLYITHVKGSPRVVEVTGIFEDPVEVRNFEGLCGTNCIDCDECESPLDYEFPADSSLMDSIIEIASNELIDKFRNPNAPHAKRDSTVNEEKEQE